MESFSGRLTDDYAWYVISCPQHIGDLTMPRPSGHFDTYTVVPSTKLSGGVSRPLGRLVMCWYFTDKLIYQYLVTLGHQISYTGQTTGTRESITCQ